MAFRDIVSFDPTRYLATPGNSITRCCDQIRLALQGLPASLRAPNGDLHESVVLLLVLLNFDNKNVFTSFCEHFSKLPSADQRSLSTSSVALVQAVQDALI